MNKIRYELGRYINGCIRFVVFHVFKPFRQETFYKDVEHIGYSSYIVTLGTTVFKDRAGAILYKW